MAISSRRFFVPTTQKNMKKRTRIVLLSGLAILTIPSILLTSCNNAANKVAKEKYLAEYADSAHMADSLAAKSHIDSLLKAAQMMKAGSGTATSWQYSQETDDMTSKAMYFASIEANDKLDFDFPYKGGSTATLTIRHKNNGNDVYLEVTPGQFNCNVINGENIRIRFDDEQPVT